MKCINIFGHRWGAWGIGWGGPHKRDDGELYHQRVQRRICDKCGYMETEWVPEIISAANFEKLEEGDDADI